MRVPSVLEAIVALIKIYFTDIYTLLVTSNKNYFANILFFINLISAFNRVCILPDLYYRRLFISDFVPALLLIILLTF